MRKSVRDRLLDSVTPGRGGCWIWTRGTTSHGYGVMWADGRLQMAHRLSHELFVGPIPLGYEVDHVAARGCLSTRCIRPGHLEAVTNAVNTARSTNARAAIYLTGRCQRDHLFEGDNIYVLPNGRRACKECRRDNVRRWRARRQEASCPA